MRAEVQVCCRGAQLPAGNHSMLSKLQAPPSALAVAPNAPRRLPAAHEPMQGGTEGLVPIFTTALTAHLLCLGLGFPQWLVSAAAARKRQKAR